MKIKFLLLAMIMVTGQAFAEQEGECAVDKIERAPNPLIEVLTIPFKMVAALTHGPRCLLSSIPKNEE